MASGYDLAYERLSALSDSREIEEAALDVLRTTRVGGYRFRLSVPADEPPCLLTEWSVGDPRGRTDAWVQACNVAMWHSVQNDRTMTRDMFRAVARRHYGTTGGVKRVYPCKKSVVLDGRQAHHGGFKLAFHDWAMDRFHDRHHGTIKAADDRILAETEALSATPGYALAYRRALEDLASENLAQRMLLFSRIPNVVERAGRLYVVKDVMQS